MEQNTETNIETNMDTNVETNVIQNKDNNADELRSIKYKSMLMTGVTWTEKKSSDNLTTLDLFLENEKNSNANEPWSKLDKINKNKKLIIFAENYKEVNSLSDTEYSRLLIFFKDCLERKKLQRVKDVIYDKLTGIIKDVPALTFNKGTNQYTLKNMDKRISTIKSLAPKKKGNGKGTAKNVVDNDSDEEN